MIPEYSLRASNILVLSGGEPDPILIVFTPISKCIDFTIRANSLGLSYVSMNNILPAPIADNPIMPPGSIPITKSEQSYNLHLIFNSRMSKLSGCT